MYPSLDDSLKETCVGPAVAPFGEAVRVSITPKPHGLAYGLVGPAEQVFRESVGGLSLVTPISDEDQPMAMAIGASQQRARARPARVMLGAYGR